MAHISGSRIILPPNSLYIHTIPLVGARFHWALICVDDKGLCTRHHWAALTTDTEGIEGYVEQLLPNGAGIRTDRNIILAYFQIEDYVPIDITSFRALCASIFPTSYPTAQQNRQANISCRTWITQILSRLINPTRALQIEQLVTARSTECSNTYATDYLFQRAYALQISTIPRA